MIEEKLENMLRNGLMDVIRSIMILRRLVGIVLILFLNVFLLEVVRCIMIS